jgi:hypothetical protein
MKKTILNKTTYIDILAQIASISNGLFSILLLLQYLSKSDVGLYYLILFLINISALFDFGLLNAIIFWRFKKHNRTVQKKLLGKINIFLKREYLKSAILYFVIILIVVHSLDEIKKIDRLVLLIIFALQAISLYFTHYYLTFILGAKKERVISFNLTQKMIILFFNITAIMLIKKVEYLFILPTSIIISYLFVLPYFSNHSTSPKYFISDKQMLLFSNYFNNIRFNEYSITILSMIIVPSLAPTLYLFNFKEEATDVGLISTCLNAVCIVSATIISTNFDKLCFTYTSNKALFRAGFIRIIFVSLGIFIFGSIAVFITLSHLDFLFKSLKINLLSNIYIFIYFFVYFIAFHITITYLRIRKIYLKIKHQLFFSMLFISMTYLTLSKRDIQTFKIILILYILFYLIFLTRVIHAKAIYSNSDL